MEQIRFQFIEEAQELLERLAESLLTLERAGGVGEAIHDAFRAAHSLKGGARLAGFPQVEAVAQALEECLGQLRDGRLAFSAPLCDLLLRGVDEMKRGLDPEAGESAPPQALIEALRTGRVSAQPTDQGEEDRERWLRQEVPGLDPSVRQTLNDEQELHIVREVKNGARLVGVRLAVLRSQFPGSLKNVEARLANLGRLVGCVSRPPEAEHLVFLFLLLTRESDTAIHEALGISCELSTLTRPTSAPTAQPAPAEPQSEALHGIFIEGIGELIEEFSRCLLLLEQQPNDPDRVNALFRVGHNLKGIGGSLGFPVLSRIGHEMEAILDRVRRGTLSVTAELIDSLLGALDSLREIFRAVQEGRELPSADPPVIGHLRRLYEQAEPSAKERPVHEQKTAAPHHPMIQESSIRVGLTKIDRLINLVSELAIRHRGSERGLRELGQLARVVDEARREVASNRSQRAGELLAQIAEQLEGLQTREDERLLRTDLLLGSLQEETLRVRMLPVGALFSTFHRLVRDVARPLGKEVELRLSGVETEMDKRILEGLADPMMHLLRNAVDHGVEPPEERARLGKLRRASIDLQAAHEGGQVVIRVTDDGCGLDLRALTARAVEMGHVSEDQARRLSEADAAELIFVPGLSTRKEATEISGRGVGMDVVRANVERMKGSVTAHSIAGQGTTFTLTLPLTLALLQALLVRVGVHAYCLPTTQVVEGILIERSKIRMLAGVAVIDHRDRTFPVVTLSGLLGYETQLPSTDLMPAIVVEATGQSAIVTVDELLAEQGVVIKGLGGLIHEVPGVAGATILGDGSVALILDLPRLLREWRRRGQGATIAEPAAKPRRARRILVADDGLTARELLRGVLESMGHEVIAAADGQDALEQLRRGANVDLVITDIMMPRLDGLGLTRAIRQDPGRRGLPIVMVTSLGQDQERRQGLEAGADAYLVKADFDRGRFLEVIENLLGAPA